MLNPKNGNLVTKKPPSGFKLDNIINEVSSSNPNKKIRSKEKKLQVQFNFCRKKYFEKERRKKEKPLSQGQKKRCVKSYR